MPSKETLGSLETSGVIVVIIIIAFELRSAHSICRLINTDTFPPMSSSTNFAILERAIVSACTQHEHENESDYHNYRRCLRFGKYFVKFGDYSTFYPEIMTLNYVADLVNIRKNLSC